MESQDFDAKREEKEKGKEENERGRMRYLFRTVESARKHATMNRVWQKNLISPRLLRPIRQKGRARLVETLCHESMPAPRSPIICHLICCTPQLIITILLNSA